MVLGVEGIKPPYLGATPLLPVLPVHDVQLMMSTYLVVRIYQ